MIYDSLMAQSPDEDRPSTVSSPNGCPIRPTTARRRFGLRPEARFHDGTPITPEDVVFSLEALKKASPMQARYYKNVVKAEKTGDHEVTFTFDMKGNRELPQHPRPAHRPAQALLGGQRRQRRDARPLKIDPRNSARVRPVQDKELRRRPRHRPRTRQDYWAEDLPVSKGQWNFDEMSFQYFRDRTAAFEEFKGGRSQFWRENKREPLGDAVRLRGREKGLG